jgi:hypothetical protein
VGSQVIKKIFWWCKVKYDTWHTVKDLIEILNQYPSDLPVLVSGYENGFENFYTPEGVTCVKHYPENMYFDGAYQHVEEGESDTFDALILMRVERTD